MLLEKKILALREELEEREAAMQVDSTWWTQKKICTVVTPLTAG